jgi:squalene synthase HpnC
MTMAEKWTREAAAGVDMTSGDVTRAMRGENFPVASRLLPPRLRGRVLAFYRYARAADDAADDPHAAPALRLARLRALEDGLTGARGDGPGAALRAALGDAPHDAEALAAARDLMGAFRRDAIGIACADWADLMDYCDASAVPVGRFLLAIHEERAAARAPSDALCAALQVLNHLQDIKADWRDLGRRYLPGDWMAEAGAGPSDLRAPATGPALRRVIDRTLSGCDDLLAVAAPLPGLIAARGLRGQACATLSLARRLRARLGAGDPLAGRVAPSRLDFLTAGAAGLRAAAL